MRALKKLKRENPKSIYVFLSQRKEPLSTRAIRHIVQEAGKRAGFDFPVNAHSLRHATGFKLANDNHNIRHIQDYMGHKSISNTQKYTELNEKKYDDFKFK